MPSTCSRAIGRCAYLLVLTGALSGADVRGASSAVGDVRKAANAEYAALFLDLGLVPIGVPRGHAPGVVIAVSGEVLSTEKDCFEQLDVRDQPSRLPSVEVSWSAAARFALSADRQVELSAHGQAESVVRLRFENVRSVSVSRMQLVQHVRAGRCRELAGALFKNQIPEQSWLLIGEVLVGKPFVVVRRVKGGGGSLSFLLPIAERLGLRVRADGGGDLARAETAELYSEQPVPIAFRPTMVVVTPQLANAYRSGGNIDRPTLETFNREDQAHRAALDAWTLQLFENLP